MKTEILTIATGGAGALATEVVQQIPPETITTVGNLLIQVVIAVLTIVKLFKKPKPETPTTTDNSMKVVK